MKGLQAGYLREQLMGETECEDAMRKKTGGTDTITGGSDKIKTEKGRKRPFRSGGGWLRKLSLCLAACLCMTACAAGDREEGGFRTQEFQIEEKKTIVCYGLKSNAYMQELVEVFNIQNSTVEVELHLLDDENYDERVVELLEDGTADVAWLRQPSKVNGLAARGVLYSIEDMLPGSSLEIANYGQSLDIVQLDEKLYSLPFVQNIWLLFYNEDIFDALSVDYPQQMTWGEYEVLAGYLQENARAGGWDWGGYIPAWVCNLGALQTGEYLYADELPATEEYLSFLNRLYNEEHSHPNLREMGEEVYPSGYEAFLEGRIGMMINGDWTIQILREMEAEKGIRSNWNAAPLPVMEGEDATAVGSNSYLAISARSSCPESAFSFLEFCCGREGASILAANECYPSYYTEESREIYVQELGLENIGFFFDTILQNEEGKYLGYQELRDLFDEEARSYLNQEKSLDESMQDYMQERVGLR